MSKIEYEAQLAEALAGVSPRAVMVCQAWHDHFGQPGWGSVDFVRGELGKATAALKALGEDVSFTARAPTPITSPALPPSVPEESETVKEKTMTEELKDNPIDCHDQADAEAKALIAASPKLKCLMWDDGGELPVEYFYMNAAGVLVVCKAFENKIAEWLKPLIKGAGRDWNLRPEEIIEEGNGARGLLKHLFPGCEFEE